jgi:hypothetical protein
VAHVRTTRTDDDGQLELEVAGTDGVTTSLRLSPDTAASLATILTEFATRSAHHGSAAMLTKRPKTFAVGTGRFERVVMIRFEDDPPYALGPELATELCEALVEAFESVMVQPSRTIQ